MGRCHPCSLNAGASNLCSIARRSRNSRRAAIIITHDPSSCALRRFDDYVNFAHSLFREEVHERLLLASLSGMASLLGRNRHSAGTGPYLDTCISRSRHHSTQAGAAQCDLAARGGRTISRRRPFRAAIAGRTLEMLRAISSILRATPSRRHVARRWPVR